MKQCTLSNEILYFIDIVNLTDFVDILRQLWFSRWVF